MLFAGIEIEVPSVDAKLNESPSMDQLDTDSEGDLANVDVRGGGMRSEQWERILSAAH